MGVPPSSLLWETPGAAHAELGPESGSETVVAHLCPLKALGLSGELVCSWGEQEIMKLR